MYMDGSKDIYKDKYVYIDRCIDNRWIDVQMDRQKYKYI